ncbi:MAG: MerR family transcriptional regulator [Sphingomonas sp.]
MSLAIGDAAGRTGCSVPTIRYYEEIGLIDPAVRAANGRRTYGWRDISRLRFIRRARDFGMSIGQVRELLAATTAATPAESCEPAKSVIAARLNDVIHKRKELEELETALTAMLARCAAQCDEQTACCTIFEDISQTDRQ